LRGRLVDPRQTKTFYADDDEEIFGFKRTQVLPLTASQHKEVLAAAEASGTSNSDADEDSDPTGEAPGTNVDARPSSTQGLRQSVLEAGLEETGSAKGDPNAVLQGPSQTGHLLEDPASHLDDLVSQLTGHAPEQPSAPTEGPLLSYG
jgi:hypothetical protein